MEMPTSDFVHAGTLAQQLGFNGLDLIVNHVLPTVR